MVALPAATNLLKPDPQRLDDDGRCQNCGRIAWDCPTCGAPCCACKTPWAGGHRQHYHADGWPYRLNMRSAKALSDEAYAAFRRGDLSKERYEELKTAVA